MLATTSRITAGIAIGGIVIVLIMNFLPVYPMPVEVSNGLDWMLSSLWKFNFVLPVGTLMTIFAIWLNLEIAILTIKLIIWLKGFFIKV